MGVHLSKTSLRSIFDSQRGLWPPGSREGAQRPRASRLAEGRGWREERQEEGAEPGEPPPREEGEEAGCFLAHSRPARVTHSVRKLPGPARDPRAAAADPGEERCGPLPQFTKYFCLGNPMDSGALRATVHGAAKELDRS